MHQRRIESECRKCHKRRTEKVLADLDKRERWFLATEQRCIWIGYSKMNRIFIFLCFFHVKKILNQWILDYCRNIRKTIVEESSIKYDMWPSGLLNVWIIITANIFSAYYEPGSPDDKESACNAGDLGSIPGLGRSPGGGNGNPLQYSCLENPMDRGAWQVTVHGVAKSRTWLSNSPAQHRYC